MPQNGETKKINLPLGYNPMAIDITHFTLEDIDIGEGEIMKIIDGPCPITEDTEMTMEPAQPPATTESKESSLTPSPALF